jgi:hypothetical protein
MCAPRVAARVSIESRNLSTNGSLKVRFVPGSQSAFQKDNTYTYFLDGNAKVFLSGADNQETGVKITAQATVVGLGNCAQLLKISSLMITGPDGTVST